MCGALHVCVGLMVRATEFELPRSRRAERRESPQNKEYLPITQLPDIKISLHKELSGPVDSYTRTSNIDPKQKLRELSKVS